LIKKENSVLVYNIPLIIFYLSKCDMPPSAILTMKEVNGERRSGIESENSNQSVN